MSARGLQETFQAATEALFVGDGERAAELLAEGVSAASAIDAGALAAELERRAATATAARNMLAAHPGLAADQDMVYLADIAVERKMRDGMSAEAAIAEAGSEIAERYNLDGRPSTRRPQNASNQATMLEEVDPQAGVARDGIAFLIASRSRTRGSAE